MPLGAEEPRQPLPPGPLPPGSLPPGPLPPGSPGGFYVCQEQPL